MFTGMWVASRTALKGFSFIGQQCDPPLVWSDISQDCVLSVDAGGGGGPLCTYPMVWSSISQSCIPGITGGSTDNTMLYIGLGLAAILLLGSFMGGRASGKKSGYASGYAAQTRPRSRTTTRTVTLFQ